VDEIGIEREEREREKPDWHCHGDHGGGCPDVGLVADV
jgi:hypothetical protein